MVYYISMAEDRKERTRIGRSRSLFIVLIYALIGGLWIAFSDMALEILLPDPAAYSRFQTYKGWFYVLVTAVMLYTLIRLNMRALEESEQRFRCTFQQAAVGIAHVGPDGKWLRVNRKLCDILGYSAGELLKLSFKELVHPEDRNADLELLHRMKQGQISTFTSEKRFFHKDGSLLTLNITVSPVRVSTEGPKYYIYVLQDITRQKELEKNVRQTDKMRAIGQLAGGIAHDFNNQLTAMMGFTQLLQKKVKDNIKLGAISDNIITCIRRSSDLTGKLLSFARKGKCRSEPVSLHELIREAAALLEPSLDKRINLELKLNARSDMISGDSTEIQNVLLNLGINARDAMPEKGKLIYTSEITRLEKEDSQNQSMDIEPGNYIQLSVSDTGTGIEPEVLKHIFEPFFTTKEEGKGTGMGLAAVYGAVKSHSGAVRVDSAVGEGSTFHLYFPLLRESVDGETEAETEKVVKQHANIMVVDDEEAVLNVIQHILVSRDYIVTTFPDGQAALDYFKTSWKQIDLVILDMVMPGLNAHQTLMAMREINPGVKTILASAYSIDGDIQKVIDEEGVAFIKKPFTRNQLIQLVARVMDTWN